MNDQRSTAAPSVFSPPAVSLPAGGGAIRSVGEKFAANPATGTASLTVPIAASPGRSGFGPQLQLVYDSGSGNGAFGFGWTLSLPSITRKTQKGLPRYDDANESDTYIFGGAEDLVPVLRADGTRSETETAASLIQRYRPRVERDFARIERHVEKATGDVHWRSISRDNITTVYGKNTESRIAGDGGRIFNWLICEMFDDKGNAAIYDYAAENATGVGLTENNEQNRTRSANRYVKRIRYGNCVSRLLQPDLAAAEWMFELVFDYDEDHFERLLPDAAIAESEQHRRILAASGPELLFDADRTWRVRPDSFSVYRAGFEIRTHRRCRRILMFHRFEELGDEPCLVRATEFEYRDAGSDRSVDEELAHRGSTRFGSFLQSVTHHGYVRDASIDFLERNGTRYATYLEKSLPSLQFEYSTGAIRDTVRELDAASSADLPAGLDGRAYRLLDLDGEGIAGILARHEGAWSYKSNLGQGRFAASRLVREWPAESGAESARKQFLDLDGDGRLALVSFDRAAPGFFERTDEEGWQPFETFRQLPNIDWDDPNLRFVDLDGDGLADVLLADDIVFHWYTSLADDGFSDARHVPQAVDEEHGPKLVFEDGTESIHLADMSGDGLTDLVRIRNGEICYWPNLGHGRFGAKVTMDHAPRFDRADLFRQDRIRLADINGSGPTDILYFGSGGVHLYFNQSGAAWSDGRALPDFPFVDDLSSLTTADLFGSGTACIVWSSPLPGDAGRALRYVDLTGALAEEHPAAGKPHLLVSVVNGLSAATHIRYAPSTKFYLEDKQAGTPWITRIPFPVHVVERVETHDRISGRRFVSLYRYRHGFFDPAEREFRGFGMVETLDAELDLLSQASSAVGAHVPPVRTRTWFHTGVYVGRGHVSDFFAGLRDANDPGEYYREPGRTDEEARALLLDDTMLPDGLTVEEERQACRALAGSILRQEIYALDGSAKEPHPYTVTESNFAVRMLQRRVWNRHAVFQTHPRETLTCRYERSPSDPRVEHELTLDVDLFGNVLRSAAIAYGRRRPDPSLGPSDQARQAGILATFLENEFTNAIDGEASYRGPLPSQSRRFELPGLQLVNGRARFTPAEVVSAAATLQKRLIDHVRTYYRPDDCGVAANDLLALLPLGVCESRALPGETFKLAMTASLAQQTYVDSGRVPQLELDAILGVATRHRHTESDADWWQPSGRIFHSPDPAATPAQDLEHGRAHFFLAHRYCDAFDHDFFVSYAHDLLVEETRDALDNRITVGERDVDPDRPLIRHGHDYRVLQPALVMDANRNRSVVAFDALGIVVATALMGKPEDASPIGDSLPAAFRADLTSKEIERFFENPAGPLAAGLLDTATTRVVYEFGDGSAPTFVAKIERETHVSDPQGSSAIQVGFSYFDGFGREIQKKVQAEGPPWVGSGWTLFDNKGNPVRRYEPFFTGTHRFERDPRIGVSRILFYDPVGRVVAMLHPDHTWEKVVFDAWRQETWDRNDTATREPQKDDDVQGFFARIAADEYLPTWHALRTDAAHEALAMLRWPNAEDRSAQRIAAVKTVAHAETPTVANADALGRPIVTAAHNRFGATDELHVTRVIRDVKGNETEIIDPLDRSVIRYTHDLLGNRIHQAGMDGGARWMLHDAGGKTLCAWDRRDHRFRMEYDELRRPAATHLRIGAAAETVVSRTIHGEAEPNAAAANLRGRIARVFDQAGVIHHDAYDFKGNLLRRRRVLAADFKTNLNWAGAVPLEATTHASATKYDALNRPTELTTPDGSTIRHAHGESRLLDRVDVNFSGAVDAGGLVFTPCIDDIDYDAHGRRRRTARANGAVTTYEYDPFTFRLTRLRTTGADGVVQDLHYAHDAAGNVMQIRDDAVQTIFFNNAQVSAARVYTHDALYRLIEATGREHVGQFGAAAVPHSYGDVPRVALPQPGDGQAMSMYCEQYSYDAAGNLVEMHHRRNCSDSVASWSRTWTYAEASLLEGAKASNRLTSTAVGATTEAYSIGGDGYDAHGNMLRMPQLHSMQWDFRDQLRMTQRQAVNGSDAEGQERDGERTWYVYGADGQRVRKVTERANGDLKEERVYLDGFEIYRRPGANALRRETLHVTDVDGIQSFAMIETRTLGDEPNVPPRRIRHQIPDHLGSCSLELGESAEVISYEEYTPYGATAYQALDGGAKRYRYSGKERDEESGLYAFGSRYYAPWLGRWTSCDRAGLVDGPNSYCFVRCNPMTLLDPDGSRARASTPVSPPLQSQSSVVSMAEWASRSSTADLRAREPDTEETRFQQMQRSVLYERTADASRNALIDQYERLASQTPEAYTGSIYSQLLPPSAAAKNLTSAATNTPHDPVYNRTRWVLQVFHLQYAIEYGRDVLAQRASTTEFQYQVHDVGFRFANDQPTIGRFAWSLITVADLSPIGEIVYKPEAFLKGIAAGVTQLARPPFTTHAANAAFEAAYASALSQKHEFGRGFIDWAIRSSIVNMNSPHGVESMPAWGRLLRQGVDEVSPLTHPPPPRQ